MIVNIKKRYAYSILGLLILGLGFLFVNAYVLVPGETPNPGHPISQMGPPADCENGQVLQFIDGEWGCIDLLEGASTISWSDITNKPSGFADNVDDVGVVPSGTTTGSCGGIRFCGRMYGPDSHHCSGTRVFKGNGYLSVYDCKSKCELLGATCYGWQTTGTCSCYCGSRVGGCPGCSAGISYYGSCS